MNRGVFRKSARELMLPTILLGIAIAAAQTILSYVLPTFAKQITGNILQMPFAQNFIRALVGADVAPNVGPEMFLAIAWVHPVVLALLWAHAAIGTTRVPAGEVDRGTADVLLSWPVSRLGVYVSDSAAWLGASAVMLGFALVGNRIGSQFLAAEARPDYARVAVVLVNLLAMVLAVGALGYLCSALSSRRGWAIGAVFALVVASFLVNYLAQFWEPAKKLEWLSVLRYYRPLFVMRDGAWPWGNIGVLGAVAAGLWVAGAVVMARRDMTTT